MLSLDPLPADLASSTLTDQFLLARQFAGRFEDLQSRTAAQKLIPHDRLEHAVEESRCSAEEKRDVFLHTMMLWFADEFFTWFEAPVCSRCREQLSLSQVRFVTPRAGELANRVEEYHCSKCPREPLHQFYRYNHPVKLLSTRVGRCGEWANCFGLCCRALGYQVRWVSDMQDHVWLEVYSDGQQRWLHCDPCERALDRPHIYESGWGKRLVYVVAASSEEVADVTHRYSINFPATNSRRHLVSESALASLLVRLNAHVQAGLPAARRSELTLRRVTELVQLLTPPRPCEDAAPRQSGPLAWRLARGEAGPAAGFVFEPSERECTAGLFNWSYSSAADLYWRGEEVEGTPGWSRLAWEARGLQRKVEADWGRVYLCRCEGEDEGSVEWRVRLAAGWVCAAVHVQCPSTEFASGSVVWQLVADDGRLSELVPSDSWQLRTERMAGSRQLKLMARLRGGDGENAFQHAQLVRAGVQDKDTRLSMIVHIKPEESAQ